MTTTDFDSKWLGRALEICLEILQLEQEVPVSNRIPTNKICDVIDLSVGEERHSLDQVFDDLSKIATMTPRTTSRRFFNQMFGGRDPVGVAAEILTTILNTSMYTYKVAGINAHIEDLLIKALARRIGFDDGEGIFCPGGSISNLLSVVLARDNAPPQDALDQFKLYTSELCHYSIRKNAGVTGIGKDNVRKIATDERGRMKPKALLAAIEEDLASGARPMMINATSGTTVLAAFDPLREIATIAERFGVWLHVDGALGGAMLFSQKYRGLLDGIELAHSVSWNPHKLMGVPLSCSALLVRNKGNLHQSLAEEADYLFQSDETPSLDHGPISLQCGRRNDALKFWATWRQHGAIGLGKRVDYLMDLAQYMARAIAASAQLTLVKTPESVNVCLSHEAAPANWVCKQLEQQQLALVGHALVAGKNIIRVPLVNPEMKKEDIHVLLDAIESVGNSWEPLASNS